MEQNLGGLCCQVWAAEDVVVCFKGRGSGLAINVVELIKNIYDPHACMSSMPIGHVRHLESIIDACVEGCEVCALNVLH